MATRTLLIMRHAHAEPWQVGRPDARRALTPAGRRRAGAQAEVVAQHAPQVVLCSSAVRTRQTLALLPVGAAEVVIEDELYRAEAAELLLRLAELPGGVASALVIGHMPSVADAVGALSGRRVGFRPGDVAVLSLPDPWHALQPATATLLRPPS